MFGFGFRIGVPGVVTMTFFNRTFPHFLNMSRLSAVAFIYKLYNMKVTSIIYREIALKKLKFTHPLTRGKLSNEEIKLVVDVYVVCFAFSVLPPHPDSP